jgi:AcrR family transcriptional regulator
VTRDEAILTAAAKLFRERGFHAVGVDEIGERAGVTGPAIYRHFSGKDEILATLYDQAMDRLLLLTRGNHHDEPFAALEALVDAHVEFALGDRSQLSIYVREDRSLADPYRRHIHRREREHVQRWIDTLTRCYPDRSREELTTSAHAAIGLILSMAHWPPDAFRAGDLARVITDVVVGGLASLGTRERPTLDGGRAAGSPADSRLHR